MYLESPGYAGAEKGTVLLGIGQGCQSLQGWLGNPGTPVINALRHIHYSFIYSRDRANAALHASPVAAVWEKSLGNLLTCLLTAYLHES